MSFKPFFVHFFKQPGKLGDHESRGVTIKVSPAGDKLPHMVQVQLAKCCSKDQFCKKTGRSQAEQAPVQWINKRYLPVFVAKRYQKLFGVDAGVQTFFYLYKYML